MSFLLLCVLLVGDVFREQKKDYSSLLYKESPQGLKVSFESSVMIVSLRGEFLSSGSGNLLSYKGKEYIATASHVIEGSTLMFAIEKDGTKILLELVFQDKERDIAFLRPKDKPKNTKAIPIRFSNNNLIGKPVYHCGHPGTISFNISEGIITSVLSDSYVINSFSLPGSSGSVVFDENGKVVGIVSSIMTFGVDDRKELIGEVVRVLPIDKKYLDKYI